MAPSAEGSSNGEDMEAATTYPPQYAMPSTMTPSKNVAFAVNYELPMVDQFLSVHRDSRRKTILRRSRVESPTNSTQEETQSHPLPPIAETHALSNATIASPFAPSGIHRIRSNLENDTPNIAAESSTSCVAESSKEGPLITTSELLPVHLTSPSAPGEVRPGRPSLLSARRTSTRDKNKREVPLARTRVKYDMQLVPPVRRNAHFLRQFSSSSDWRPVSSSSAIDEQPEKRRSSRFVASSTQAECPLDTAPTRDAVLSEAPFLDDNSVVWIPTKRSEWEDTISEMTSVCTAAAMRRALLSSDATAKAPFQPPLSRDYIRDRIDIDDPLNGYQIRHRHGGWMQGFILYTTFTTWTYGFRWDSQHPLCGIEKGSSNPFVDQDGSLALELESLSRSGDPGAGGIVFPAIAEIGLLGGLGCGEYLLRMALDDILSKSQYKYVILQATEQSRTFYERYGFVRVGAICQYGGGRKANLLPSQQSPNPLETNQPPEVVGYRHWTHANESEKSLQMHGGPSYMMCLRLPERSEDLPPPGSFVEALLKLRVETKPRVEQLGPTTTPVVRRSFSMPIDFSTSFDMGPAMPNEVLEDVVVKKVPAKRGPAAKLPRRKSFAALPVSANCETDAIVVVPVASVKPSKVAKSKQDSVSPTGKRPYKRRKILEPPIVKKRGRPPSKGKPVVPVSAYVEKQYNSIWLAVSPVAADASIPRRPPPKSRDSTATPVTDGDRSRKEIKNKGRAVKSESGRRVPAQTVSSRKRSFSEISSHDETDSGNSETKNSARCPVSFIESILSGQSAPVIRMSLRKQKVVSYPRNRTHYYNRVVKRKNGIEENAASAAAGIPLMNVFYFVLEYNEDKSLLCLVPLAITGKLTGKRLGRPRYQCSVDTGHENFVVDDAINYMVVPSAMIMKTPIVVQEAWDIATDADVDFCTR